MRDAHAVLRVVGLRRGREIDAELPVQLVADRKSVV